MQGSLPRTKLFSTILLATAGSVLSIPGATQPLVLSLLPLPFLLSSWVGTLSGILPLVVGLAMLTRRPGARKLGLFYCLGLMADGFGHLMIWFWTGGLIGPPFGFLAIVRVIEGLYLGSLVLASMKEWSSRQE